MNSSYERRLDRISAVTPTGLPPVPSSDELRVEADKIAADPSYPGRWSAELVQAWTVQLEREVEEADHGP